MSALRPELLATGPLPERIARLPLDARGYPVPWFVEWLRKCNGCGWTAPDVWNSNACGAGCPGTIVPAPEFRAMDLAKWRRAIRERRCWVCGERLGQWLAFVVGPMCVVNRTTSEPPCHRECATWAAIHCPFLSRPHMVRRHDADFPADDLRSAGFPLARNPGVAVVYVTKSFEVFNPKAVAPHANAGLLIAMGEASAIDWFAEGRPATRDDVTRALARGLPAIEEMARQDPDPVGALRELAARVEAIERAWLPA